MTPPFPPYEVLNSFCSFHEDVLTNSFQSGLMWLCNLCIAALKAWPRLHNLRTLARHVSFDRGVLGDEQTFQPPDSTSYWDLTTMRFS